MAEVEAKVAGVTYDAISKMPVVLLKELDGNRVLPIWIGPNEAISIAFALEKKKPERPLTQDLLKSVIEGLDAHVTKIVVNEIRDSTYYARIYLSRVNSIIEIDARPSDSIAIALRIASPIYISEEVLEKGGSFVLEKGKDLKEHFKQLKPEDFGKFKL